MCTLSAIGFLAVRNLRRFTAATSLPILDQCFQRHTLKHRKAHTNISYQRQHFVWPAFPPQQRAKLSLSLARATLSHRVAAVHSCLLHTLTHPLRKSSSSSSSSVSIEDIVAPFGGIISADAAAVDADNVSVASVLTQADEEVLASDSRMWLISGGIGLGINLLRPRPVSGVDREHEQTHGIYIHIGLCQLKLCA